MQRTPENPYREAFSEGEIREREIEARREEYARLFDRQVETLIERGYVGAAGMPRDRFRQLFATLKREALDLAATRTIEAGHIPFVIVPGERLLSLEKKISLIELEGKRGYSTYDSSELENAEDVKIPELLAYLIVDVENGEAMIGKSANEAARQFKKNGRSPLTVEEGVAIVTQYPEILKDHYLSLPGSVFEIDDGLGVANLWLREGKPELNWSWSFSAASGLGSASCGSRVGV
ncbi:MAG: DUF5701 family protein [Patescibacteria group bacterium]